VKKVVVISGVGLGAEDEWSGILKDLEFDATFLDVQEIPGANIRQAIETAEAVLIKGPWTATPEERLYGVLLAKKMEFLFSELKQLWSGSKSGPRVLAVGRGALAAMSSPVFFSSLMLSELEWRREFVSHGPWVKLDWYSDNTDLKTDNGVRFSSGLSKENENVMGQTLAFGNVQGSKKQALKEFAKPMALLLGRAIPKIDKAKHGDFEKWLVSGGIELGWKCYKKKLCLSLVDILAYGDRTQNQNFGYSDLTQQPTRLQILEHFLKEG
jgi:hypothetical protein